jgi:hypothetical protein
MIVAFDIRHSVLLVLRFSTTHVPKFESSAKCRGFKDQGSNTPVLEPYHAVVAAEGHISLVEPTGLAVFQCTF